MSKEIKKIVVVGGGSAGWMSAATIATQIPTVDLTVIESPDFAILGVGESTLGGIKHWTSLLGLNDKHFLQKTDGIYKLSIKFTDFEGKGTGSFHYPFGMATPPHEQVNLNDWYLLKESRSGVLDKNSYARSYFPITAVAEQRKISTDSTGKTPGFSFDLDSAFHFDATAFGQYLKNEVCLPRGTKLIHSTVDGVVTNENGVDYLKLKDGSIITADLFIDCTGFKSMLLGDALDTKFNSISDIIPNNKAWATHIPYKDKKRQLEPFTNCTALTNGWVWNIPLWSRIGGGYVYSDKYISSEDALKEFKNHIKHIHRVDPEELEYRPIDMKLGLHNQIWKKNVIGIGLAAGFIEPLESTGLLTTYEFLLPLAHTLRRNRIVNQWDRDAYNFAMSQTYYQLAQFVALHYAISPRRDSDYWMDITERCRISSNANADIANSLSMQSSVGDIVATSEFMFTANARYKFGEWQPTAGFQCIAAGMDYSPIDPALHMAIARLKRLDTNSYLNFLTDIFNNAQKSYQSYASQCPSMYDYLRQNIHREAS